MDNSNNDSIKKEIHLKEPIYRIDGLDLLINPVKYQGTFANRYRPTTSVNSSESIPLIDEEDRPMLSLERFKERMIHDIIQFTPENTSRYDFIGHILFLLWKDWMIRENT